MEIALLCFDEQGVVQEAAKNQADMGDVFHEIAGEYTKTNLFSMSRSRSLISA